MLELIGCGVLLFAAYLIGSTPTGYLAGRLLKGIDIRDHGSGSTGATNVLRTMGKGPALIVFLVDTLKGASAIGLINGFYAWASPALVPPETWQPWLITLAAFAAVLGHSKSIWLNFTGGKSVATSFGVLLAMYWPVGLGTFAVFATVVALWRVVSIASLAGVVTVVLLMVLFGQPLPYLLFAGVAGCYVVLRHISNIKRLLAGTEPRLGQQRT